MGNGKRQEVAIGDLAVAEHSLPTDEALLQQADLFRPENVAGVFAGFLKPLRHLSNRPMVRIGGLGHDPEHAILRDRARGPAVVKFPFHPVDSGPVHYVPAIQQGNDHVDVEQRTH